MIAAPSDREWILVENCGPFARHAATIYMTLDQLAPGEDVRFGFRIEPHHCNLRPVCHGGMLATFLDVALARGLRVATGVEPPIPTISISMDFMAPAPLGSWVDARVTLGMLGKSTGFISAMVHADGEPVLRGSGVFRHFASSRVQA